jgi:hypothetical protein
MRVLMDEWEATAEIGWSRPLTVEEARCVLSALSEGVVAMTTAESRTDADGEPWIGRLPRRIRNGCGICAATSSPASETRTASKPSSATGC